MKKKTVRLDEETKSILLRSRIEGNQLYLMGQLDPATYKKVAKVIEAAGGKWNRKAGCHVFPDDVRETLDIHDDTIEVTNIQQTFQAFYTPEILANQIVKLAGIERGQRILEPSAGDGALLRALPDYPLEDSSRVAVEINERAAGKLSHLAEIHCKDFLKCSGELGTFDRVIMNPPFTGGQDIAHIRHAISFLRPGGRLVAICANGPKQREELAPLADQWIDVPAGAFKESGTNVATAIVVIEKKNPMKTDKGFSAGWIGVDLDGTLAVWRDEQPWDTIGEPVKPMVDRVKKWLSDGHTVKVFTARVAMQDGTFMSDVRKQKDAIAEWTKEHVGVELEATSEKDHAMIELWDDRAVGVRLNTGMIELAYE